jgi:signal transduction histidine kinase
MRIAYPSGGVVVEICSDDQPAGAEGWHHDEGPQPPEDETSGHGLTGMRERVAVFGGQFEAAPRPEGGFRLWATLPFGDPARVATGGHP